MSGHSKWSEIKHKATPEQLAEARAELDLELGLADLRKALDTTQAQLARVLEMTQPGVSRVENQADLYVSTLRSYIEALGGRLEVTAVFGDVEIPIDRFGSDRARECADFSTSGVEKLFEKTGAPSNFFAGPTTNVADPFRMDPMVRVFWKNAPISRDKWLIGLRKFDRENTYLKDVILEDLQESTALGRRRRPKTPQEDG